MILTNGKREAWFALCKQGEKVVGEIDIKTKAEVDFKMEKEVEIVVEPEIELEADNIEGEEREVLKGDNSLGSDGVIGVIEGLAESTNIQGFVRGENLVLGSVRVGIKIRGGVEMRGQELSLSYKGTSFSEFKRAKPWLNTTLNLCTSFGSCSIRCNKSSKRVSNLSHFLKVIFHLNSKNIFAEIKRVMKKMSDKIGL